MLRRLGLRFDSDADEAAYRAQLAVKLRRPFVIACAASVVLLAGMYFVDPAIVEPEALGVTRLMRYGVGMPAALAAFAFGFSSQRVFAAAWQAVGGTIAAIILAVIPAITIMVHMSGGKLADGLVHFGLLCFTVGTLAFHTLFGISFLVATAATLSGALIYVGTFLALGQPAAVNLFIAFWAFGANGLGMLANYSLERFRRSDFALRGEVEREHARSEALLLNVLPAPIAERLKANAALIADGHAEVTILFADIVGFTDLAARLAPAQVVEVLNRLFTGFDELTTRYGLEKIKTIGDAYMVVGGIPEARTDHAEAIADMALAMRVVVAACARETGHALALRIGIHSGPVVAGVIGKRKFAYDLWGDAVNTASRMESHGIAGEIQVTEAVRARLAAAFVMRERGTISVKGKGDVATFLLERRA